MTATAAPPSLDTLLPALARDPRRSDLAAAAVAQALAERREEDALPAVVAAARALPGDPTLLHCLGLLHRALGDLAPAIAAFDAALERAPASARLVHARARAALEAGHESASWFARARALAPNDGDVILGEAAALLAAKRSGDADALLAGTLRLHPGWIVGHEALIRLRHASGAADTACDVLDAAIDGAPRDPRLHTTRVLVAHRAGRGSDALAALARAERALGDDATVRELGAIVATEHGAPAAADAAFARVDPAASKALAIYWMRHLLRRGEPGRVTDFASKLPTPLRHVAWPYLSIAWRQTQNPRAEWLDDPALVRVFDLDLPEGALDALATRLRALHVSEGQPLDQSVRGGTQTDGPLFSRLEPEIVALKERIRSAVARYLAELPPADPQHPLLGRVPARPRFAGSWSVRLSGGGHHDAHVHDEGLVSSAFYVALPAAGDTGELTLGAPQASLGLALGPTRTVAPRPGRLVLFPSTLWHATRPFARGERLTVAFDVA